MSFIIPFSLWWIISYFQVFDETLLATPKEVFHTIVKSFNPESLKSEKVHIHLFNTIILSLKGWGISMFLGVFFGMMLGRSKIALNLFEPSIDFIRSIPPILAFPLLLVAYNFGEKAYVYSIVFGCFPIIVITVSNGINKIIKGPFEILEAVNVKKMIQQLFYIVEIIPSIILSARLSFPFSVIIAVVCEMVFTPRSGWALGALARDSEINFDTPLFYSCVILIGIYGYLINKMLIYAERQF